jgi:hypothetical protein
MGGGELTNKLSPVPAAFSSCICCNEVVCTGTVGTHQSNWDLWTVGGRNWRGKNGIIINKVSFLFSLKRKHRVRTP